MQPHIKTLPETKLIGKHITMSFANNKTGALWKDFMPRRSEIKHTVGSDLYSVEVYNPSYFQNFNSHAEFQKWAAVEVTDVNSVPSEMETITVSTGLYAVFLYKGPASAGAQMYQYIYGTWLPNSEFSLDDRPHFALMGEKYKHEDPSSEEEIWIPIKKKE